MAIADLPHVTFRQAGVMPSGGWHFAVLRVADAVQLSTSELRLSCSRGCAQPPVVVSRGLTLCRQDLAPAPAHAPRSRQGGESLLWSLAPARGLFCWQRRAGELKDGLRVPGCEWPVAANAVAIFRAIIPEITMDAGYGADRLPSLALSDTILSMFDGQPSVSQVRGTAALPHSVACGCLRGPDCRGPAVTHSRDLGRAGDQLGTNWGQRMIRPQLPFPWLAWAPPRYWRP